VTGPAKLLGQIRMIGKAESTRILAEILANREGRNFISSLTRKDAELCIEVLTHVSRDLYTLPPSPSQMVSLGPHGA